MSSTGSRPACTRASFWSWATAWAARSSGSLPAMSGSPDCSVSRPRMVTGGTGPPLPAMGWLCAGIWGCRWRAASLAMSPAGWGPRRISPAESPASGPRGAAGRASSSRGTPSAAAASSASPSPSSPTASRTTTTRPAPRSRACSTPTARRGSPTGTSLPARWARRGRPFRLLPRAFPRDALAGVGGLAHRAGRGRRLSITEPPAARRRASRIRPDSLRVGIARAPSRPSKT